MRFKESLEDLGFRPRKPWRSLRLWKRVRPAIIIVLSVPRVNTTRVGSSLVYSKTLNQEVAEKMDISTNLKGTDLL